MESNHKLIQNHVKKYNRTYWFYFLAYIVVIALALSLDAPMLFVGVFILAVIHIITRCVDVAEMDYLKNAQCFDDFKDRHHD